MYEITKKKNVHLVIVSKWSPNAGYVYRVCQKTNQNIVYSQLRIKVCDIMEVYCIHLRKKHFLMRINEMFRKIAQIVVVFFF